MKKGKYEAKRTSKVVDIRVLVVMMAVAVMVSCVVGGSVAWLLTTASVTNTFTYGDINIALKETSTGIDDDGDDTTNEYPMMPGETIAKDPKVTVLKGSEDCWLFVKLTESANLDDFIIYEVDTTAWAQLLDDAGNPVAGVYFRLVKDLTADYTAGVLKGDQVQVKDTVTKAMLNALDADSTNTTYPTLTVTAYAVQYSGFEVAQGGTENAAAYQAWQVAATNGNP